MFTKSNAQALGARGGRATLTRHGTAHFRAIGRKGYLTTLARHWQGDRRGFARWLHARAALAVADALADVGHPVVNGQKTTLRSPGPQSLVMIPRFINNR